VRFGLVGDHLRQGVLACPERPPQDDGGEQPNDFLIYPEVPIASSISNKKARVRLSLDINQGLPNLFGNMRSTRIGDTHFKRGFRN
jgi:hypothetical protein